MMAGAQSSHSASAFAVSPVAGPAHLQNGSFTSRTPAQRLSRFSAVSVRPTGAAHMHSAMTTMPPSRPRPSQQPSGPRSRSGARFPRKDPTDPDAQTYTECGKCGAAYEITAADLGDGKKVVCAICDHSWFQRADSLRALDDGCTFGEYPVEEKDDRIAAKQARRDARAQRAEGAGTGRGDRSQQYRGAGAGSRPNSSGRHDYRDTAGASRYGSPGTSNQSGREYERRDNRGVRDREGRGSPGGAGGPRAGNAAHSVFIGNLPFSVTADGLEELLRSAAQVERVSLVTDPMGRSKGFAFADMKSAEDVSNAVEKLNGYDIDGRSLTVRVGKKKEY